MYLPAPDESVWVGVARLVLAVPGSRGLKDKRRAVHQVRDRLRARRNISIAEVGHLDDRSRAVLAISMVGNDARFVQGALDSLIHEVGSWRVALVESASVDLWRPFDEAGYDSFEDEDA